MLWPNGGLSPSTLGQAACSFISFLARGISTAQWMLERQLRWIVQAERKTGALVTLDIEMLSALAAALGDYPH
jgi:hypothetical protein